MIEITAAVSDEAVTKVEVRGHGGRKAGSDIVCAAVSAITETALAGLLHYAANEVTWNMDEGYVSIQVEDIANTSVAAIMKTMMLGLKQIEREYPKRVSLQLIEDTGITDKA